MMNNQPTTTLDDLLAEVVQVREDHSQWEKEIKDLFQSIMEQRIEEGNEGNETTSQ